ncbi:hypothetical protein Clacol_007197 [Clathrus columnatus]|uniref:RNA-binding protein 25 n=1 Tax=Clathrus columnatus TaxID=1419009 RepID=A0AAV5AJB3_9AGAM|nr:hypothetical protein Clacol_007197 [Clathrus columnatus]
MQPTPNRMGLGMRPTAYGQGPSMAALAQQQQGLPQFVGGQQQRVTTLFIGSISGGITDAHLNEMLDACGPLNSFKRLITPANKPQGFGFAEFQDPEGAWRAVQLLNGVELPALEDGCANKKLLVKADEKTTMFLNAYRAQRPLTDADNAKAIEAKVKIDQIVEQLKNKADEGTEGSSKEKFVIPPHLHDLQEAELPEAQRGLVISEIALFRERAAKREREKLRDERERGMNFGITNSYGGKGSPASGANKGPINAPSGPKGKGSGPGPQGYSKAPAFVQSQSQSQSHQIESEKTDEQKEQDRKDARARDENESFKDRERRYEPRERQRIANLERTIQREKMQREGEARDKIEMHARLDVWDDDESDELFYTDRARWRSQRRRHLSQEESADRQSRDLELTEAEHLRRESELFLARQMEDMRALQEEQRKAGLLLDDGAPVRLNVSLTSAGAKSEAAPAAPGAPGAAAPLAFGQGDDEEEELNARKRRQNLSKVDFAPTDSSEKVQQRLEKIKGSIPSDKETLWKVKVRWDAVNESLVDRKFEPIIKRKMTRYLGELEDDDLVMFVMEHLKDRKSAHKLVDELAQVLEEDAEPFVIDIWRQVTFESVAYGEGLDSGKMLVDE